MMLAGVALGLAGCGQNGGGQPANDLAAANSTAAAATAKRPAYCFFKDDETKGWTATADAAGNVVVKGKAYREDSRYKTVLGEPVVNGTSAEVRPTIGVNDTGYATSDNWWDMTATIPGSGAVQTVAVRCGAKTIAELTVRRKR